MTRRLVTYVAVAYLLAVTLPSAAHAAGTTMAKHHAAAKHHTAAKAPATPKVDLNTAATSDLTALPGIDDATAQKIVSMRPYTKSSQLVSKNIVTKEEFSKIRSRVIARQEPKKAAEKAETKEAPKAAEPAAGTTK